MSQQISFETYRGSAPENYEKYFVPVIGGPLATDLVARAALRPGERVLDLACGTGVVARLAAERVGATGTVVGVDINPGMLAVARAGAPSDVGIEWREAGAERLPVADDAFDVVLCSLGVQFFADRPAALRELRRVLVPGGRVVLNAPGPIPQIFTVLEGALARHAGPDAAAFVRAVFSLYEPGEIRRLFEAAGFQAVDVAVTQRTLHLPVPRAFVWQYVHSTPLAAAAAKLDEDGRAALEREVAEEWEPHTDDRGLVLQLSLTVASARRE